VVEVAIEVEAIEAVLHKEEASEVEVKVNDKLDY
jgi:hypothetical protein